MWYSVVWVIFKLNQFMSDFTEMLTALSIFGYIHLKAEEHCAVE